MYDYVALKNKPGTFKLLKQEHYSNPPKTPKEAALMLTDIVNNEGDAGLKKIAEIHPDKDFILDALTQKPGSALDMQRTLNADAETTTGSKGLSEKSTNILILAGTGIVLIGLVTLIATSK